MKVGWVRGIGLLWWLAQLVTPGDAHAGVPPVRPIGMVLRVQGELDHATQVDDIRRGVAKAKADGVQLVVLEIQGRAWRYDIARSLAEFVATAEPPVAVFTTEGSIGVAISGASANAGCWANADLTLERDDEATEYAEDSKRIKDDFKFWVESDHWSVLKQHEALRASVLDPRKACWLVEAKDGTIATANEEPDDAAKQMVVRADSISDAADIRLRIPLRDARLLGLLAGEAADAAGALQNAARQLKLKNVDVRPTVWLGASLDQRHSRASEAYQQIQVMLAIAERQLIIKRDTVKSGPAIKNMAGATALSFLAGAKFEIAKLEELLRETPEIQRLPAPGQSSLITKRSVSASRWRKLMQQMTERSAAIERRAIEFRDAK